MQIPPETQVVIDFDDNRAASALVGPASHFDVAEAEQGVARLRPGHGAGEDVVELLNRVRSADRQEPLWTGVKDLRADNGNVKVEFATRHEPHLQRVEGSDVEVSCHRYHDPTS